MTPATKGAHSAAVVGAGIAGLACARALAEAGLRVRVFEKARGAGGRASTRREEERAFDHGAQFFTARDPAFARLVSGWVEERAAARWDAMFAEIRLSPLRAVELIEPAETRYVGTPGMSALARQLAKGLEVRCGLQVGRAARARDGWRLSAPDPAHPESALDLGRYDLLAVAVPAPQAVPLLADAPALAAACAAVQLEPCLALMAAFSSPLAVRFDAARVTGGPLSWIACDSSKPDRPAGECWVAHATPDWSRARLEQPPEAAAPLLLDALAQALGVDPGPPGFAKVHRWRHALAGEPLPGGCLHDPALGAGACGDWTGGARIEGAWRAGVSLAARLLGR